MTPPRDDELVWHDGSPDVEAVYLWLATDARTGMEEPLAVPIRGAYLAPLMTTDKRRALRLEPRAQAAAQARRTTASLVVFKRGDTLVVTE